MLVFSCQHIGKVEVRVPFDAIHADSSARLAPLSCVMIRKQVACAVAILMPWRARRGCALQAVQPRFLSSKWEVGHAVPREFGPHSIYAQSSAQDPGRGEWLHSPS